jgi:ribokinase
MVFGPAYLDRVLRVDRPLVDHAIRPPLDESVEGILRFTGGEILELVDSCKFGFEVKLPSDWPGPSGRIDFSRALCPGAVGRRSVRGLGWGDDLGGMGAGFAAALGGTLIHALGADDDPTGLAVAARLSRQGIDHRPIRLEHLPADWTLLVTSAEHGDKLAIGFRGCHAALEPRTIEDASRIPCDLRVAAALPNRLCAPILAALGARCRMFAPAMRNVLDRNPPISSFSRSIDLLCCNRREWEALSDREEVAWTVSILVITDGPEGARARFTTPQGEPGLLRVPAFPRSHPPRDTNRAGEAFAATLVSTLLGAGWDAASAVVSEDLMRTAMLRASAAAALVLDHVDFGFPKPEEIDAALRAGGVS